ncbi:MAG: hypothetical protein A2Z20_06500 [Bdellovibrionales bacterium RBG_16_40_8]|nr:MAG: hypothetical protein A2Z20_06500 [Bdellovibrionales bacterium RBG_16_40_8]
MKDTLCDAALNICKKIKLFSGMAHIEFRYSDAGPKVLDIGLRLGGAGLTHQLVEISTGKNLIKAVLAEFCDMNPNQFLIKCRDDLCLLYLVQVESGGQVKSLPLFNISEDGVEVIEKSFFIKPGDTLRSYPNFSGVPGYALVQIQKNDQSAYAKANRILNHLRSNEKVIYL